MDLNSKLQLAYKKIKLADKILIIGHVFPDADALASMGAMIEVVQNPTTEIYAYADRKLASAYDFIPNIEKITSQIPPNLAHFSLIIILDCGSISRTSLEKELKELLLISEKSRPYIIEFDHHPTRDSYADLEVRLPAKAATTEIIYQFLQVNKLEIDKKLATCILIGLMADTGNFFHSNSSQEVLAVSSEMLSRGASLNKIIKHTVYNRNFSSLKIWGRILENMVFNKETGLVVSALTQKELEEFITLDDMESQVDLFADLVSFLNSLEGVSVALLLREKDGEVKGSLRTNLDNIDVANIARSFGGGGHKKAAGFIIKGKLIRSKTGWNIIQS